MQVISNLLVRPRRDSYKKEDLGPTSFTLNQQVYRRKDFVLQGVRGNLKCSWFSPIDGTPRACVVYCHGNSGSRRDALEIKDMVLTFNYSLFAFDFGGCGQSEGEYVSLGHFEQDDIAHVVEYLKKTGRVTSFALWGRSMGAVAAMLYASQHPDVPALVLDSPFSSLPQLTEEIANQYKFIPGPLKGLLLESLSKHIQKSAGFCLNSIEPLAALKGTIVPTVLIHSTEDSLVDCGHSKAIFEVLQGPKFFLEVKGEHNACRSYGMTVRVLSLLEYFITISPDLEDGNTTLSAPLPDLSETRKQRLKKRPS